jgi:hypothetical protein
MIDNIEPVAFIDPQTGYRLSQMTNLDACSRNGVFLQAR